MSESKGCEHSRATESDVAMFVVFCRGVTQMSVWSASCSLIWLVVGFMVNRVFSQPKYYWISSLPPSFPSQPISNCLTRMRKKISTSNALFRIWDDCT